MALYDPLCAPLLSTAGTPGQYIHPPKNRWEDGQFKFCGEKKKWPKLKEFVAHAAPGLKFEERLKLEPFGHFVDVMETKWHWKGNIFQYLYFSMVYPDRDDELHFRFGAERVKFGRREFGMMVGLQFRDYNGDIPKQSMCFAPDCYLSKFRENVTLRKIREAFKHPHDPEVVYRMGLVYFIYGIIMGLDTGMVVPTSIFHIIEDLERVKTYPWGQYIWNNLLWNIRKSANALKVRGHRNDKPQKPTVGGCLFALQFWAFNVLPRLPSEGNYANYISQDALPMMLRWECREGGVYWKKLLGEVLPETHVVGHIQADNNVVEFLRTLGLPEEEITAPRRQLPAPAPPAVAGVTARGRRHIAPVSHVADLVHERPAFDVEDERPRRFPRRENQDVVSILGEQDFYDTDNLQGSVPGVGGGVSIPIPASVQLETLMPVFTRLVETAAEKFRQESGRRIDELKKLRAELKDVKAGLKDVNAELKDVKAEVVCLGKVLEKSTEDQNVRLNRILDLALTESVVPRIVDQRPPGSGGGGPVYGFARFRQLGASFGWSMPPGGGISLAPKDKSPSFHQGQYTGGSSTHTAHETTTRPPETPPVQSTGQMATSGGGLPTHAVFGDSITAVNQSTHTSLKTTTRQPETPPVQCTVQETSGGGMPTHAASSGPITPVGRSMPTVQETTTQGPKTPPVQSIMQKTTSGGGMPTHNSGKRKGKGRRTRRRP